MVADKSAASEPTKRMRRLGIAGGIAPVSTAFYYKRINDGVHAIMGGRHTAPLVIWSCDMHTVVDAEEREAWDEVGEELGRAVLALQRAGCTAALLACNSVHTAFAAAEEACTIPLLHIADAAADAAAARGLRTLGLLSHRHAAKDDDFFAARLAARGLRVVLDELRMREELHRIIFDELVHERVAEADKRWFRGRVGALQQRGAEAVVIACTELTLLTGGADVMDGVPLLDRACCTRTRRSRSSRGTAHVDASR